MKGSDRKFLRKIRSTEEGMSQTKTGKKKLKGKIRRSLEDVLAKLDTDIGENRV